MDRSTVTVNWDDGDEKNREIENKDENITRRAGGNTRMKKYCGCLPCC